jgi:hypothetical protein
MLPADSISRLRRRPPICSPARFSPAGAVDWTARYTNGPLDREIAVDIAVDDTGNVYVAGVSNPSYERAALLLVKYDSCWKPGLGH